MHDTISWGGAVCLLPELIKRYYGSTAVFAKIYRPCVQYMEYMESKERLGGLIEHGLGDWGRDIAFGNHQANIETAIYYKCLRNVALMAQELGYISESQRYAAWADRIYAVYNQHLLVTDKTDYPYAFYTSRDNPGVRGSAQWSRRRSHCSSGSSHRSIGLTSYKPSWPPQTTPGMSCSPVKSGLGICGIPWASRMWIGRILCSTWRDRRSTHRTCDF